MLCRLSNVAAQSWFTGPCANIEDTGNQIVINCGDNSPLQRRSSSNRGGSIKTRYTGNERVIVRSEILA